MKMLSFSLPNKKADKRPRFPILLFCLLLFVFPLGNQLMACGGTPTPPCGRSVFLAKFTPAVVILPPSGGNFPIPVGILPFAFWDNVNVNVCPQPVSASLTLNLICLPSGAAIGPQNFSLNVPIVPGPQPIPGGVVNVNVPANTFANPLIPQICLVVGTYNVTFSDSVTLSFTGDTEVCLVPPSSVDDTKPRLNMEYLSPDNSLYQTCRRGDQSVMYFLVENNDPDNAVNLDLSSIGRQVAQLPDGVSPTAAYPQGVYAISQPALNTDTYPASFAELLSPGELLSEPDPSMPDSQLIEKPLTLAPCEATIIAIALRSYGMCANGSCNERLIKLAGTFTDGSDALACASSLLVVGEVPGKTSLCEVADSIKSNGDNQAVWSPAIFIDNLGTPIPHSATFYAGNLPPANPGFQTTGANIPTSLFPESASDYVRTVQPVGGVFYSMNSSTVGCDNFFPGGNEVLVLGLDNPDFQSVAIPLVTFIEPFPLSLTYDVVADQLVITFTNDPFELYNGPASSFFSNPNPEWCVNNDICRVFTKKASLADKSIYVLPQALTRLFQLDTSMNYGCDTFTVFDQNGQMVAGMGEDDLDETAISTTVNGEVLVCYQDLSNLPLFPATTVSFLRVSSMNAINNEVMVPIAIRVKPDTTVNTVEPQAGLALPFTLYPPKPNPFQDLTQIRYKLTEAGRVSIKIFDLNGRFVNDLQAEKRLMPGEHSINWDGRDYQNQRLPSGVFYIHLTVGNNHEIQKVVFLK